MFVTSYSRSSFRFTNFHWKFLGLLALSTATFFLLIPFVLEWQEAHHKAFEEPLTNEKTPRFLESSQ